MAMAAVVAIGRVGRHGVNADRLFGGTLHVKWQAWSRRLGVEGWIVLVGFADLLTGGIEIADLLRWSSAPWAALGSWRD